MRSGAWALLAILVVTALFWPFLILIRRRIEVRLRQLRKRPEDRRSKDAVALKKVSSVMAIALLISFVGFSVEAGFLISFVSQSGKAEPDREPTDIEADLGEVAADVEPDAEVPAPSELPAGPITSVEELTKVYFRLSAVHGSAMLALYSKLVLESDEISMDTFTSSEDRLISYIEERCTYRRFLDYHSGLKDAFPQGDRVDYGFEQPEGLEDCLAELRGTGEKLENCANDADKKAALWHLIVRGKDSLYFGKPLWDDSDDVSVTSEQMWAFAEITFTSIVNRLVCGGLEDSERLQLYYISGQVFQYLADIADTDEFRRQMNYVAAVFFKCACDMYVMYGSGIAEYANNVFFNEMKTVYNIAVTVVSERRTPFFEEMKWAEEHIDPSLSSNKNHTNMRRAINELGLYSLWRDTNGA